MIKKLPLLMFLVTPLYGAPELAGSLEALDHHASASSRALSGEHHKQLELEDEAEWSASTEVLDENHAWFQRRRRSVTGMQMKIEDLDDLEAAESVVFMPAHLREKKKTAFQDCRKKHQDQKSWRNTNPYTPHQVIWECNGYCCYPLVVIN